MLEREFGNVDNAGADLFSVLPGRAFDVAFRLKLRLDKDRRIPGSYTLVDRIDKDGIGRILDVFDRVRDKDLRGVFDVFPKIQGVTF